MNVLTLTLLLTLSSTVTLRRGVKFEVERPTDKSFWKRFERCFSNGLVEVSLMDETNISGETWTHRTNSSGMNLNNALALACLQVHHIDVIDNCDTRWLVSENERGDVSLATAMSQVDAQSAERLALASLLGQPHDVIGSINVVAVRKIT